MKKLFLKPNKSIIESLLSLGTLHAANMLIPLITLPYLIITLGAEKYGIYIFATTICVYFQTIIDYGFKLTTTREISQNRDDIKLLSFIISATIYSKLILSFISLIILAILIPYFGQYAQIQAVFYYAFLSMALTSLFPVWFFQGIEKMRFITFLNLFARAIFAISIFWVIKQPGDYVYIPLINSIGALISLIAAYWIIFSQYKIKLKHVSFKDTFAVISKGTPVFLNNVFPLLYNHSSLMLLGLFGTPQQVGSYGAAKRIVEAIGTSGIKVISQSIFPHLSKRSTQNFKANNYLVYAGVLLAITFILFAPIISKYIFTDEFLNSKGLIRLLGISVFFLSVSSKYGTNYLLIQEKDKQLMSASLIASLCGFIVAIPLIYYYYHWGAALTILFSRALLSMMIYIQAEKVTRGYDTQFKGI